MAIRDHSSDTREKILEAALNVFSEKGFHAATTRIIAREADVNEVTLFRLFQNKMGLFKEILKHVRQIGYDATILDNLKLGAEESIRFIVKHVLELFDKHPREYRIMHHAVMDKVENFEEEFVNMEMAKLIDFLEVSFTKLQKLGKLHTRVDPKTLSHLLHATIIGLASGRILGRTFPVKSMDRDLLSDGVIALYLT